MNLYTVFFTDAGRAKFALSHNKRAALRFARKVQGEVTKMIKYAGPWDAPTLRALSDQIADYRNTREYRRLARRLRL